MMPLLCSLILCVGTDFQAELAKAAKAKPCVRAANLSKLVEKLRRASGGLTKQDFTSAAKRIDELASDIDPKCPDYAAVARELSKINELGKARREHWLKELVAAARTKFQTGLPTTRHSLAREYVIIAVEASGDLYLLPGAKEAALRVLHLAREDVAKFDTQSELLTRISMRQFDFHAHDKDYELALAAATDVKNLTSLSAYEKIRWYFNVAEVARLAGHSQKSLDAMKRAAQLVEKVPPQHAAYAKARYAVTEARVCFDTRRYQRALRASVRAIGLIQSTGREVWNLPNMLGIASDVNVLIGNDSEALKRAQQRSAVLVALNRGSAIAKLDGLIFEIDIQTRLGQYREALKRIDGALIQLSKLPDSAEVNSQKIMVLISALKNPICTFEEKELFQVELLAARDRVTDKTGLFRIGGLVQQAVFLVERGMIEDSRTLAASALSLLEEDPAKSSSVSAYQRAIVLQLVGRTEEASEVVGQLAKDSTRPDPAEFDLLFTLAERASSGEQRDLAKRLAMRAIETREKLVASYRTTRPGSEQVRDLAGLLLRLDSDEFAERAAGVLWEDESRSALATEVLIKQLDLSGNEDEWLRGIGLTEFRSRLRDDDVMLLYGSFIDRERIQQVVALAVTHDSIRRLAVHPLWKLVEARDAWWNRIRTGRSDTAAASRVGQLMGMHELDFANIGRLFVSESPTTFETPFAAMITRDGKRVMEHVPVIGVSALVMHANRRPLAVESPMMLAVGDVDYGNVEQAKSRIRWSPLPATKLELEAIHDATKSTRQQLKVLRGRAATKKELTTRAGKANVLHLATHAAVFQSALSEWSPPSNPFGQSGVILSNANREGSAAILSGMDACRLNLDQTRLVVLAGCNTRLGYDYRDMTVASMSQAFHIAGARNVVATIWNVDDASAAAFTRLLYHYLWSRKQPLREAVRNAQLTLYRNPQLIDSLARSRGPDFKKVERVTLKSKGPKTTPTRLWAGFQLSGMGGLRSPEKTGQTD